MFILSPENLSIIGLLVLFAFYCVSDIRYGLYIVILSMPLYLVRFSILGIPSTLLEVMVYVLFLSWLLWKNKRKENIREQFGAIKEKKCLFIGTILLFSGLLISTAYSSDIRVSLGIVKGWFFDPFLFFLILISCIKEKKDIMNILSAWMLSGVAVAVIGILYLLQGNLTFDGRLSAFYLSPNHLAMYLAPVFLITAWSLLEVGRLEDERTGAMRLGNSKLPITNYQLRIIILLIIMIPLYFSHSYGAFFGIAAGLSYMFGKRIFESDGFIKKKSCLAVFLVIFFFGLILGSGKIYEIESSGGRSSFHSRLMIWRASFEMIKESPLVGIGPGAFQDKYLSLADKHDEQYLEWAVPQPHNIFLAFYLQNGLLGLIGFIAILFWFFTNMDKMTVLKALMLYFLFHGLIDTTYWKNDLALMFWLVVGLSFIEAKKRRM